MNYQEILEYLAPCGINCSKCISFYQGEIKKLSNDLRSNLGNFGKFAEKFKDFNPVFAQYPSFEEFLEYLAGGDCQGCRGDNVKFTSCKFRQCTHAKGVDFCFQCEEFPCELQAVNPQLKQKWLDFNNRMKEIGVEAFWEESQNKSRY